MMIEDWIEVELWQICQNQKGKKPKRLVREQSLECSIPYINIKAFEKGVIEEYTDGNKCNICEDGDLLMVWDGSRAGFVGKGRYGAIGSTLVKINPIENIKKEYLFYYLQSLYKKINSSPRGVGIPHVDPSILWNSTLKLPPLPIQKAIVNKIEELFLLLEEGITDLEKAQNQLKIYRESVLKNAFNGTLVPNTKPLSVLKLNEIAISINDGDHQAPPKSLDGVPFITISNIDKINYSIDFNNCFSVPDHYYNNLKSNRKPQKNDILYTVTGSFGIPVLISDNTDFCFQRHIALIKLKSNINPHWAYYLLKSPAVYIQAKQKATGTAQKTIGLNSLRDFSIPFFSENQQNIIVEGIESRFSVCDELEHTISEALEKAVALRQSILKKAFSGELLTENEINACKKEAGYEASKELLNQLNEKNRK